MCWAWKETSRNRLVGSRFSKDVQFEIISKEKSMEIFKKWRDIILLLLEGGIE